MRIGFDPHLDNINAAFSRRFESSDHISFELLRRPRWADAGALLPLKMTSFCIRFFFSAVFRYDLVHMNSAKVGLIAWAASFFGARYVYTIHGCPHPELERQEGAFKAFLSRVEAACIPDNDRSLGLLEKAGFVREGYARRYLMIDGRWQDHVLLSRMAGDDGAA